MTKNERFVILLGREGDWCSLAGSQPRVRLSAGENAFAFVFHLDFRIFAAVFLFVVRI